MPKTPCSQKFRQESLPATRNRRIGYTLPRESLFLSIFCNMLESRPAQHPYCSQHEAPDDDLIFVAVALEAHGDNIFFLGILTEVYSLIQAERLGAF